jgi:hypothetical protein
MTVPSSGELSLQGIKRELETNNYTASNSYTDISLEDLSDGTVATINTDNHADNRPDGSAPHSMSEFYAYAHSAVTSWTTEIADFTSTGGNNEVIISAVKSLVVAYPSGDTTFIMGGGSTDTSISVSNSGDPGTSGTDNSASGFQPTGTTITATGGATTFYIRFKSTMPGRTGAEARVFTATNNSIATTTTATAESDGS